MVIQQNSRFFVFLLSVIVPYCVSTPLFAAELDGAAEQEQQRALTTKVIDHFRTLDAALYLLAQKAENNIVVCSDRSEYLERIDFLRNLLNQVVFCMEQPADKKSLQFLCTLSSAMLECSEWLASGSDVVGAEINLEKIKVTTLSDDLCVLEHLIETNDQRCRMLTEKIQALKASFFIRLFRRTKAIVGVVLDYTIKSKIVMGVGAAVAGLYLLTKLKTKEDDEKNLGSYAFAHRNKYGKREMTANNLYNYAPKGSWYIRKQVKKWFDQNYGAYQAFVEQPGALTDFMTKKRRINAVLQDKHLTLLSAHNIVFPLPNAPEWIVKISGPHSRACLQAANQDKPYGRVDLVDQTRLVPTYQTASRSFGALKLKEAIEKYKLDEVAGIESCLWSPNRNCDDEHCVVLEQMVQHVQLLRDYSEQELETLLTEKKIGQLLLAAKHVGLWNLTKDNIGINTATGKIVLLDLEQPNTTKVAQQCNKDRGRYLHNINSGVQSFYKELPMGSKLRDYVESWARRDPEIMSAGNNANDLLPLFEANKKTVPNTLLTLAQETELKKS
jgi:hypothetical protein